MNRRLGLRILNIISIAMVIGLAVVIVVSMSGEKESSSSLTAVSGAVSGLFENDKSSLSTEQMVRKYYGLNVQDYEGVVLYFPNSNMDARELLLVKLSDAEQANEVLEAIEERRQTQINVFEGYAPEQYNLYVNSVTDVQGGFVLFVVHPDADRIDEAFRGAL